MRSVDYAQSSGIYGAFVMCVMNIGFNSTPEEWANGGDIELRGAANTIRAFEAELIAVVPKLTRGEIIFKLGDTPILVEGKRVVLIADQSIPEGRIRFRRDGEDYITLKNYKTGNVDKIPAHEVGVPEVNDARR